MEVPDPATAKIELHNAWLVSEALFHLVQYTDNKKG